MMNMPATKSFLLFLLACWTSVLWGSDFPPNIKFYTNDEAGNVKTYAQNNLFSEAALVEAQTILEDIEANTGMSVNLAIGEFYFTNTTGREFEEKVNQDGAKNTLISFDGKAEFVRIAKQQHQYWLPALLDRANQDFAGDHYNTITLAIAVYGSNYGDGLVSFEGAGAFYGNTGEEGLKSSIKEGVQVCNSITIHDSSGDNDNCLLSKLSYIRSISFDDTKWEYLCDNVNISSYREEVIEYLYDYYGVNSPPFHLYSDEELEYQLLVLCDPENHLAPKDDFRLEDESREPEEIESNIKILALAGVPGNPSIIPNLFGDSPTLITRTRVREGDRTADLSYDYKANPKVRLSAEWIDDISTPDNPYSPTIRPTAKTDDELFNYMYRLFRFFSRKGTESVKELCNVFIDEFRGNSSNKKFYSHVILNDEVARTNEMKNFVKRFGIQLNYGLSRENGNITVMSYQNDSLIFDNYTPDNIDLIPERIAFSSRYYRSRGLQILVNDTETTYVYYYPNSYEFNSSSGEWKITLCFEIIDHFGLDTPDVIKFQNYPYVGIGFASWWVLQHQRGYIPFKTKIIVLSTIKGNINKLPKGREGAYHY